MKKSIKIVSLFAASTLLLAGCKKAMTPEQAKDYANKNYSQDTVDEKYSGCSFTMTTKVNKATGLFEGLVKDDTGSAQTGNLLVLSASIITDYTDETGIQFAIKGSNMLVDYTYTATLGSATVNYTMEVTYSKEGLLSKTVSNGKAEIKDNKVLKDGVLDITYTTDYTYTTK